MRGKQFRRAWVSLGLYPIALLVAFVVGEGVGAWLGVPEAPGFRPPWWIVAIVLGVAVAIVASPLAVTVHYSNRAAAQREIGARVPVVVALVIVGSFTAVNLVSVVFVMLT